MVDLKEVSEDVARTFGRRASNFARANLSIKIITIICAAVGAICTFAILPTDKPWPVAAFVGIGAVIFIGLGQFYSSLVDKDASNELELARIAVELARQAQRDLDDLRLEYSDFERYETEQERANELYRAMFLMRDVAETILRSSINKNAVQTIVAMLEAGKRSLSIALGYQMAEHFTLCIYIAEEDQNTHKTLLRCVAQTRTQDCPIEDARKWPSGVGVAGAAFARNSEVVVPDLATPGVGPLYAHQPKNGDEEKYKSIAAVPISFPSLQEPWGVVVATSDRAQHFHLDSQPGVHTVEAVRALAAMAALAVAIEKAGFEASGEAAKT